VSATSNIIGSEVEIVRQRFFIEHTSESVKYLSEEYTLRCKVEKGKSINNIILTTPQFLPNLKIYDSDGTQLALTTNEYTKALFEDRMDKTKDQYEKDSIQSFLEDMKNHKFFVLWIKLPQSNRFHGQDLRVITLEYDAKKEDIDKNYNVDFAHASEHDVFYIIRSPDDYDFDLQKIDLIDENETTYSYVDSFEEIGNKISEKIGEKVINLNRNMNSISIWVKPNIKSKMRITYSFKARSNIISFPKMIIGILTYFSLQLVFFKQCLMYPDCSSILPTSIVQLMNKDVEVGIGIVGSALVLAGLVHNHDIRDSLKWWFFLPIIITLLMLLP